MITLLQQTTIRSVIMKIGYIRVSTEEQNTGRQEAALDVDKVFIDKISGKNTNRPALKEMLDYVRDGDTLIVESISRLARSTKDLLQIVEQLKNKGVEFISLKENIDTSTPQGRFMLTVFGAMAELERENILQRQAEGIAIAKEAGKYKGRQPIKIDEDLFSKTVARWKAGEITAVKAMEILNLKPNTFYRRVKERV